VVVQPVGEHVPPVSYGAERSSKAMAERVPLRGRQARSVECGVHGVEQVADVLLGHLLAPLIQPGVERDLLDSGVPVEPFAVEGYERVHDLLFEPVDAQRAWGARR
jgi:hypothetical protein